MEANDPQYLSIIVPAYQCEDTIGRAVKSAIELAGDVGEVIVVNDGSTDATGDIAKSLLRQDGTDVYIEQSNQGRSAARNAGLSVARGDWIAFIDADDWVFLEAIPQMHSLLRRSCADVVVFRDAPSYTRLTGVKEIVDGLVLRDGIMKPSVVRGSSVDLFNLRTVWGKLYRAKAIEGIGFVPGLRFGEDALFNIAAYTDSTAELYDICCYRYDIATASTCNVFRIEDVKHLSRFVNAAFDLSRNLGLDEQMVNQMCVSELLELFYRAGGSDVSISETSRAFESLARTTSRLDLDISPERSSLLETVRAITVLVCIRHGLQGLALRLERTRGMAKTIIRRFSGKG